MILKNSDALEILAALRALAPFKVGEKARYAISKNIVVLSRVSRDLNAFRQELEKGLGADFNPDNDEQWQKFITPFKARMESDADFPGVLQFPFDDLHAEENQIPIGVVNRLAPLLTVDNG